MRDEDGNEEINSAWHALYLETDTDGPTAIIEGNTVPADIETMNTLAEGLYPAESDSRSRYLCDCVSPSFCGGTILKMRSLLVVIEQFSDDHTADIGHYGQTAISQLFSALHFIIFD